MSFSDNDSFFLTVDGFHTEVKQRASSTKKTLLIGLHGFGGSAGSFRKFAGFLPDDVTFWSLSLPWHGKTSDSKEDLRLDVIRYADDLARITAEHQFSEIYIIAHSFGARIGVTLAQRHPQLINGMFLMAPGGFYFPEDMMFRFLGTPPFRWLIKKDFFIAPYVKFLIPNLRPEKHDQVFNALRKISYSFPKTSIKKMGVRDKLKEYPGKVILIWGDKDRLVPASFAEKLIRNFSSADARIHVLKKTGHLPMAERPEKTAAIVTDVISEEVN